MDQKFQGAFQKILIIKRCAFRVPFYDMILYGGTHLKQESFSSQEFCFKRYHLNIVQLINKIFKSYELVHFSWQMVLFIFSRELKILINPNFLSQLKKPKFIKLSYHKRWDFLRKYLKYMILWFFCEMRKPWENLEIPF